jgi:nucleotide-binding universal stress UspA family protein
VFSRVAVEFAVRYAEVTGSSVTVAVLREKTPEVRRYATEFESFTGNHPTISSQELELGRISSVFHSTEVRPTLIDITHDPASHPINDEVMKGNYDLVIIGAENRAIQHRLFFGYQNDWLLRTSRVAVAIVVPNVAALR